MATQAPDIPSTAIGMDASSRRINGLDTIRFVCAFVVMAGHLELLPGGLHGADRTGLGKMLVGVFNSLFNGPAAVIIFFLISGFCIHFPFRSGRRVDLAAFYTRRFFRIVPPAVVFFVLWRYVLHESGGIMDMVLWSVFCEVVYYFLYPGLLFLRRRYGWLPLVGLSTAAMAGLLFVQRGSLSIDGYNYTALGTATWIVGLPCWLLGCWLAENYLRFKAPSSLSIWGMRFGVYGLSVLVALVHFHADSFFPPGLHFLKSNCILLNLFVLPACVWLGYEIAYGLVHGDNRLLEWAGTWSYSLYLVHLLVPRFSLALGFDFIHSSVHLLVFVVALAASYLFYRIVERPSHRLAVTLGRRMAPAR